MCYWTKTISAAGLRSYVIRKSLCMNSNLHLERGQCGKAREVRQPRPGQLPAARHVERRQPRQRRDIRQRTIAYIFTGT